MTNHVVSFCAKHSVQARNVFLAKIAGFSLVSLLLEDNLLLSQWNLFRYCFCIIGIDCSLSFVPLYFFFYNFKDGNSWMANFQRSIMILVSSFLNGRDTIA